MKDISWENTKEDFVNCIKSDRVYFWDNYKGILIFLVVFGHFLIVSDQYPTHIICDAIYMFHMPAFIFISGYFGKSEHSRSSDAILKLLTAYILFNGLASIAFDSYTYLTPFGIYWYIVSLVIYRLSMSWLVRIKGCLLVLTTISILIGYSSDVFSTFALSSTISFAPFYMAGYLLSNEMAYRRMICKSPQRVIFGILLVVIAFLIGLYSYNIIGLTREDLFRWPYSFPGTSGGIGRCCLILTATLIIWGLGIIIPNKKIPLLTRFGKYSLTIYLFNILYLCFNKYVYANINNEYLYLVISFLATIVTCYLFSLPCIVHLTDKLLVAGANLLKGNQRNGYYTLAVRILFCFILGMFLLHEPILLVIDYLRPFLR